MYVVRTKIYKIARKSWVSIKEINFLGKKIFVSSSWKLNEQMQKQRNTLLTYPLMVKFIHNKKILLTKQ